MMESKRRPLPSIKSLVGLLAALLLTTGCGSDALTGVTTNVAQSVSTGVLSQRRLLHESELAKNPTLRADLKRSVVLTLMESDNSGDADLGHPGVDEIPYLLQQACSVSFRLETTSVREIALFSGTNRMFTMEAGETQEIWLPAGEYRLRLTARGGEDKIVATGFIDSRSLPKVSSRSVASTFTAPGVYVSDVPNFGTALVGIDSGISAILGAGPGPMTKATVQSVDQLPDTFFGTTDTALKRAVETYFANGGITLQVIRVPSAVPSDLTSGLTLVGDDARSIVLADFPLLSQSDADQVMDALTSVTARQLSVALFDLPSGISTPSEAQAWLQARPQYQIDRFCFFWPSALESGEVLAVSPSIAGAFARGDAEFGPTNLSLGYSNPLADLTSLPYVPTLEEMGLLGSAGINPLALWNLQIICLGERTGSRTLQIPQRRTLDYLDASIKQGLMSFQFAPNDATTWSTAVAVVSTFLNNFWSSGGLDGFTVTEAFSVTCGLGSTMTNQDILNGNLILKASVNLVPSKSVLLTFVQPTQDGK